MKRIKDLRFSLQSVNRFIKKKKSLEKMDFSFNFFHHSFTFFFFFVGSLLKRFFFRFINLLCQFLFCRSSVMNRESIKGFSSITLDSSSSNLLVPSKKRRVPRIERSRVTFCHALPSCGSHIIISHEPAFDHRMRISAESTCLLSTARDSHSIFSSLRAVGH